MQRYPTRSTRHIIRRLELHYGCQRLPENFQQECRVTGVSESTAENPCHFTESGTHTVSEIHASSPKEQVCFALCSERKFLVTDMGVLIIACLGKMNLQCFRSWYQKLVVVVSRVRGRNGRQIL
jgi:hypothetical protein